MWEPAVSPGWTSHACRKIRPTTHHPSGCVVTAGSDLPVDREGGQGMEWVSVSESVCRAAASVLTPLGPLSTATEKHNGGSGTARGLLIKKTLCDYVCVCEVWACLNAVWAEVISIYYALNNTSLVCKGPHAWMFFDNCCAIKAVPNLWCWKNQWEACVFNYSLPPISSPSSMPKMRALCPVTTLLLFLCCSFPSLLLSPYLSPLLSGPQYWVGMNVPVMAHTLLSK